VTPFEIGPGKIQTISGATFGWWSDASFTGLGTYDTALGRNAAGVVEINSGTLGTFRDLKARTINATSGFQVGGVQIAASNLSNGVTGSGNIVLATGPTMSNPVVGTQASSDNSTLAASTAYVTTAVSNAIAGVNPAVAVQAA